MPRDQRMPQQVRIGVSHTRGFTKRKFNQGVPLLRQQPSRPPVQATPRKTYPTDDQVREVAQRCGSQAAFRERSKQLASHGYVGPVAKFYHAFRTIVMRIRAYHGKDAIIEDIRLELKERVAQARISKTGMTLEQLSELAKLHIDRRESMLVVMARQGKQVPRPSGRRTRDHITVIASLPDNPGAFFFITLGPGTKRIDGRRVECERRILAVQTEAEWNAWKRTRMHEPRGDDFRRDRPRGRSVGSDWLN